MAYSSKVDLRNLISKMISVSDLSRGMASKIIQKVSAYNEQYIIVKNNKPEAVIISINEYMDLLETKEQYSKDRNIDFNNELLIKEEEIELLTSVIED